MKPKQAPTPGHTTAGPGRGCSKPDVCPEQPRHDAPTQGSTEEDPCPAPHRHTPPPGARTVPLHSSASNSGCSANLSRSAGRPPVGTSGASPSKISRIELGRSRIKDNDLGRMLTLYDVTDPQRRHALLKLSSRLNSRPSWHEYGDVVTTWFSSYLVMESIAEHIRSYEVRFIPGLLQTPAYANALFRMHYPEEQARRRVDVRMRRQHHILRPGPQTRTAYGNATPTLWAVIDESALHERIGHPNVMREQIDFLINATSKPNVRIQILPTGAGAHTGVGVSF